MPPGVGPFYLRISLILSKKCLNYSDVAPRLLTLLLILGAGLALASPVAAHTQKHHPALHQAPLRVSIKYDSRMQAATKIANAHAHRHSHRQCWHAVKNALLQAKVVSSRPSTRYAKQAGDELQRKYAFKKIQVKDPHQAPLGAILVYGGRGAGHVEIRTQKGFVSDFANTRPSRRPLLGVYVSSKMIASSRGRTPTRRL